MHIDVNISERNMIIGTLTNIETYMYLYDWRKMLENYLGQMRRPGKTPLKYMMSIYRPCRWYPGTGADNEHDNIIYQERPNVSEFDEDN